jgi:hypothetical protein
MRINGWQRFGAIASFIWAIAAPIYIDCAAEREAREAVLLHYELCQNAPTTNCYIQANLYDIAPRYIPVETT